MTYLDLAVEEGEPHEDGNEAHDEAGEEQHDGALQPVERQDAGAGVHALLAARRARQAVEVGVVGARLALQSTTNSTIAIATCIGGEMG